MNHPTHTSAVPGDMAGLDPERDLADAPNTIRSRALAHGDRVFRRLTTSEGVEVALPVAPLPARAWAWLTDAVCIFVLIAMFWIGAAIIADLGLPGLAMSLMFVSAFFIRNFYFVFFETRHQGRTPGKRLCGLRVVDRHGRPLRVEAVFVRNVTRDLETILPLVVLLQPEALFPDAPAWGQLVSGLWLFVALVFPLFNRERLRIGDLLAGTFVTPMRRHVPLQDDPAIGTWMRVRNERPVFSFSHEQLDQYGIFELQLIEGVLIESNQRRNAPAAPPKRGRKQPAPQTDPLELLCSTIRTKIGWAPRPGEPPLQSWQFVYDFYAALRARHERRLLLGQRQPFKREGQLAAQRARPSLVVQRHSGMLEAVRAPTAADATTTAADAPAADARPS